MINFSLKLVHFLYWIIIKFWWLIVDGTFESKLWCQVFSVLLVLTEVQLWSAMLSSGCTLCRRHQALQKFHRVIFANVKRGCCHFLTDAIIDALHLTAGNDNETKFAQNLWYMNAVCDIILLCWPLPKPKTVKFSHRDATIKTGCLSGGEGVNG